MTEPSEKEKREKRERKLLKEMAGLIDYEFMKVDWRPPKRTKSTDTLRQTGLLLKDLNRMLVLSGKRAKRKAEEPKYRGGNASQRCTVKMRYFDSEKTHLNFVRSYMPQKNKDDVAVKPKLFGPGDDELTEEQIGEYEKKITPLHFRFVVSPESQKAPLKAVVRSLMKRLEAETGFSLTWVAVEHHDRPMQHAHVLVNGADAKTGKEIRFPRRVVTTAAREAAQAACTQLLGAPSAEERKKRRQNLPLAQRYTTLDAEIDEIALKFDPPKEVGGAYYEKAVVARNEEHERRLRRLVDMGFALEFKANKPPVFYLEKNWTKKLKTAGRYNTYLTARASLAHTSACNLEQYTPEAGTVEGVVTSVFAANDDEVWTNGIVIENKGAGKAWFLPLWKLPEENVKGKMVKITAAKNQKGLLSPKIILLEK